MKNFYVLFSQEIAKLLHNASTYFYATLFFLLIGFNFTYILYLNIQSVEPIDCLKSLFEVFWLPALFIIPIITMRSLSEEQKSGILESILSTPVGTYNLVLSKFFAMYLFYLALWFGCLCFPLFTQHFLSTSADVPIIVSTTLTGGLLFIASTTFLFISIGIFASSLTRTQTLAGFLCFCFLFITLVCLKTLGEVYHLSYQYSVYVDFFEALDNLCKGILDVRPFLCHIGCGILFLLLTATVLESKILR